MKKAIVIGGGVSGLAAAWRLRLLRPDAEITVLEAAAQIGGKLISLKRDGFLAEGAADGFLARKPPIMDWVRELGLESELVEPTPEHRFSQVWWQGRLHAMPEGLSGLVPTDPAALARSSLLTPEGSRRAAAEADIAPRLGGGDESLRDFLSRRYGPEAFERLMEPLLAGIFAGDANQLSAEAAVPQLVALERSGQSLSRGMAQRPAPAPGPAFRSFSQGMSRLPAALAKRLGELGVGIETGQAVTSVEAMATGFLVRGRGKTWPADALIVALPPRQAATILGAINPAQAEILAGWPVSSVANLQLAFRAEELPNLPGGSGYVVPRASGARSSAATWSSQKWPGRAPEDHVLLRIYFGGARDPQAWQLPESELVGTALAMLRPFAGKEPAKPLWQRVFRWPDAFAQPNLGHADRLESLEKASRPGLVLAGGYFQGPGIPDCLNRAGQAAETANRNLS